jgi:hypothetical protein
MIMSPAGLGTKNDGIGEGQQQFVRQLRVAVENVRTFGPMG